MVSAITQTPGSGPFVLVTTPDKWAALTHALGRTDLIGFGKESIKEVKKVVWPTRKEALQMTGYVFAFVVVMALFLWLTDKTLEWLLYDLVLGWKR